MSGHEASGQGSAPGVSDCAPAMGERLFGELTRDVVVEDCDRAVVAESLGRPPRVSEHLVGGLAGPRHHPGDQDDEPSADPVGDDRRDVPAERLRDHDDVLPAADRIDHDVGVAVQSGGVVLDGRSGATVS